MVYIVGVGGTLRENSRSFGALKFALDAAAELGAETEILSVLELDLPMYVPTKEESDYGENVGRLLKALRRADGILFSTGAYHGIMAGVTKNMIDFIEFMHHDEKVFLHNRAVGLIATAGGTQAAVHTVAEMITAVHALRGIVVPLAVPISSAGKAFSGTEVTDEGVRNRLTQMASETVRLAQALNPASASV